MVLNYLRPLCGLHSADACAPVRRLRSMDAMNTRSTPVAKAGSAPDRRGACGNVNYGNGYTGTYSGNAETAKLLPEVARAAFLSRLLLTNVRENRNKTVNPGADSP